MAKVRISKKHQAEAQALAAMPQEVSLDAMNIPTEIDPNKPVPEVCVFIERQRRTCIRVKIGNKGTAYIPMDAEGIVVKWRDTGVFNAEWMPLGNYDIRNAASQYLQSSPAMFGYISAEAQALLMEILQTGHLPTRNEKEFEIMAAKNKKAVETTGAVRGGTTAEKKATKGAVADPEKKAKAAPAKAAGKAVAGANSSNRPREGSKMSNLLIALEKGKATSLEALSDASGYDVPNTRTAIGILRSKNGFKIEYDKAAKLYTLA